VHAYNNHERTGEKNLEATKVGLQCSNGLDYSESKGSCAEVGFLHQLVSAGRRSVGSRVLVSTGDDVKALCLVKECRELETALLLGLSLLRITECYHRNVHYMQRCMQL